jgi:hypothetical protein
MLTRDIRNEIIRIVRKETIYLRTFKGKVLDNKDDDNEGRVIVAVLELGLETKENGLFCYPRDKNSMSVPAVDDWVEVYFENGDIDSPRYRGTANEIKDMLPKNYENEKTHVLFENPDNDKEYILYDAKNKKLTINIEDVTIKCNDAEVDADKVNVKANEVKVESSNINFDDSLKYNG